MRTEDHLDTRVIKFGLYSLYFTFVIHVHVHVYGITVLCHCACTFNLWHCVNKKKQCSIDIGDGKSGLSLLSNVRIWMGPLRSKVGMMLPQRSWDMDGTMRSKVGMILLQRSRVGMG